MKSKASLKKALWKLFSAYVKKRDNNICVTCGKRVEKYEAQGGHYIAAGACGLEYYFSEFNVHCQCTNCNLRLEGNRPAYRSFIIRTYGIKVLKDIETNYHKPCPSFPFQQKITEYKEKLKLYDPH